MDILPIAYHFLKQFSRSMGKDIAGFDNDAVRRLMEYNWPGNVRQLRNAVERAVILCERDRIGLKDLPLLDNIDRLMNNIPATNEELKRVKKEIRQKAVIEVERNFVVNALVQNDWNVTRAAKKTGLQRTNFQNLMKKHGITRPPAIKPVRKRA
jgi:DNA-binding NtrC family response regulator